MLQMHHESEVGHIGGNLSCLDVMLYLHHFKMMENDEFVLSKGHAAGALYITLWSLGVISDNDLKTFCKNDTIFTGHPVQMFPYIKIATGSLGHGFPVAVGMALANKLQYRNKHVFCLTSDGEWQEGSNWEALIFCSHHRLSNLTVIIDSNRLQGFGRTEDIAMRGSLSERLRGFGPKVFDADGHSPETFISAFNSPSNNVKFINLHTIKGKGVPFMENRVKWHYLTLDDELFRQACNAVDQDSVREK